MSATAGGVGGGGVGCEHRGRFFRRLGLMSGGVGAQGKILVLTRLAACCGFSAKQLPFSFTSSFSLPIFGHRNGVHIGFL